MIIRTIDLLLLQLISIIEVYRNIYVYKILLLLLLLYIIVKFFLF